MLDPSTGNTHQWQFDQSCDKSQCPCTDLCPWAKRDILPGTPHCQLSHSLIVGTDGMMCVRRFVAILTKWTVGPCKPCVPFATGLARMDQSSPSQQFLEQPMNGFHPSPLTSQEAGLGVQQCPGVTGLLSGAAGRETLI